MRGVTTASELFEVAYDNVVGIDPALGVHGGYETYFYEAEALEDKEIFSAVLPLAKRIKLAEVMIGRWTEYKSLLLKQKFSLNGD